MEPRGIAAAIRDRGVLGAAILLAAVSLGALFAYSAFIVHPAALPAALALLTLAVATAARPEVGLAAAFLMVPVGNLAFPEGPSWLLLAAWSGLLLALSLLRVPAEGTEPRLPRLGLMVVLYLVVGALGLAVAGGSEAALPGIRMLVVGSALFFAVATLVRDGRQVQWVIGGAAASAALTGGLATYQYVAGESVSTGFILDSGRIVSRVAGGLAHPNQLAGFLVLLLPFTLAGASTGRRMRPLYVVAAALALLGVYFSFSRAALVALAVVPLVLLRGRRMIVVLPLLALLVAAAAPDLLEQRFATLTQEGSVVASRIDIWTTAAHIWSENPVAGVGLGGFPEAYAEAQVAGKLFLPSTSLEPPPHAHNLFLNSLAEQGLVGLVALLALLVAALRNAVRLRRHHDPFIATVGNAALATVAAFVVHNAFDTTLLEGTGIYLLGLLGLVSAVSAIGSRQPVEEATTPTRGPGA